jgi:hypothetical protein
VIYDQRTAQPHTPLNSLGLGQQVGPDACTCLGEREREIEIEREREREREVHARVRVRASPCLRVCANVGDRPAIY